MTPALIRQRMVYIEWACPGVRHFNIGRRNVNLTLNACAAFMPPLFPYADKRCVADSIPLASHTACKPGSR